MSILLSLLTAAVLAGTPLLFGTLGEILTEKSGNLNLGVEGIMFMSGIWGLAGIYYYEQLSSQPNGVAAAVVGILSAFAVGMLGAFIFSVLTITLKANQNVTGLALTIFGTGAGNFFGEVFANEAGGYIAVGKGIKSIFNAGIPGLSDIPVIGPLLFSYNFMVYLGILLALIMAFFLKHTRIGLNLRAVGENPGTADAAGINVARYKYLATCIGGGISGLGGLYIVMNSANGVGGVWVHNCISGYGWLAVALVIFAVWSPVRAMACALVFGALSVMRYYFPAAWIPPAIYDIFPYIATVLVLILISMRKRREQQPPESLGLSYFREER